MADNPLIDTPDRQQRIREQAYHLWQADGCPPGRDLDYWERARELVGMQDSPEAGRLPNPSTHQTLAGGQPVGIEEAEIQQNLGEFPDRLADQGEWQPTPQARHSKRGRRKAAARAATAGPPKPAGST